MEKNYPFFNRLYLIVFLTIGSLLSSLSSFAQQWDILGNENLIASAATTSNGLSMVVLNESGNEVPYVAFLESNIPRVKKRNANGSWTQVGNDIDISTAIDGLYPFLNLFADNNGKLYVSYIQKSTKYVIVQTYNSGTGQWQPLNNNSNNKIVSSVNGIYINSLNFKSPRSYIAFDSSNDIYIAFTAGGICNIKKYNQTNNSWESFGSSINTGALYVASQKLIFDENGDLWLGAVVGAAWNSTSGNIKLFKYNSSNQSFEDTASPTLPTHSIRELDMTLVKGVGQPTSGNIAIAVNNTSSGTKGTVYLYDKSNNAWSTEAVVGSTTKAATFIHISSDDFGNLYCNWLDQYATTARNICRVKKLTAGQTTSWNELLSPTSTVGIDEPIGVTNIAVANGSSIPYVVYTRANSSSIYTPVVQKYGLFTTWNGTAWTNAISPDATVEATIAGSLNTTANINAKKLLVNNGANLTVTSNNNITVQNEIINNGTITVENNANLIQVNNTTNTGNITVNRNSHALKRLDYTLWSSPVAAQNLLAFSPSTVSTRFYTYDSANNNYSAVDPSSTSFAAGTGYLIRMPNDADATNAAAFAGQFTGVPNNGNISLTGLTAGQFYAVGNPYPSTIDATAFFSANATAGGTLYFWRKTNNQNQGTAPTTSYATLTNAGGVANTGGGNAVVPNGKIQVGQGFIINSGSATSLNFTNAMRAADNNDQFLKTSNNKDRVWLNLTSTAGAFSQALIAYMDGATTSVDNGIDGKYINDCPIALTSEIEGGEYIIQGRPAFEASDVVKLNFKTDAAGEYTIAIDHADGLFGAGQEVYLVDNLTGIQTNLQESGYTFTAASGIDNSRFTLKYQLAGKEGIAGLDGVTVFADKGIINVASSTKNIASVKVFDMQGRVVASKKKVSANTASMENVSAKKQVLIVEVKTEDNNVVRTKILN